MKNYAIKWLSYSVAGEDRADALRRAKEFVRRNIDDLVVNVEERTPKRSILGRILSPGDSTMLHGGA